LTTLDVGRCACRLGSRGPLVVELRDVPVALRVIVVRIDDNLPSERLDRHRTIILQRHRDDDDVSGGRRLAGGRGANVRSERGNQLGQCLRPARVADHDVVAVCHRESGDLTPDVSRTNQSNCGHGTSLPEFRRHFERARATARAVA
jgi:hypothetical protein